jgi:hypothetical protein
MSATCLELLFKPDIYEKRSFGMTISARKMIMIYQGKDQYKIKKKGRKEKKIYRMNKNN